VLICKKHTTTPQQYMCRVLMPWCKQQVLLAGNDIGEAQLAAKTDLA
jgi:hypothetical protein